MTDSVELKINDVVVEHFEKYTITADLYTAADAFSLQLANPGVTITPGMTCELYINGTR